jgi:hypothetical protein
LRIASTSAPEIGAVAVAGPVDGVPVGAGIPGDADVLEGGGGVADPPAVGVTLAACLEPKIADTMLPKTLMLFSDPKLEPER